MAKPNADGARYSVGVQQGTPGVGATFNKFETHKNPQYPIGYKVEDALGNIYRYAQFAADINRGVLVSSTLAQSGMDDNDNKVTPTASVVNAGDNAIGSKYIEMNVSNIASVIANDYAGGRLVITDDTGEGYTYDVVGNFAKGTPATDLVRIQLRDPLQVALDATSDVAIQASRWANLVTADTTNVNVSGVTCASVTVATASFGWVQSKGDVGILQDGACPAGSPVQLSDGTAGAFQMAGGSTASAVTAADLVSEPFIGWCIMSGDTTGHGICHINVD